MLHWLLSIFAYAIVMIATPGPNNILMANSGAIFGFRKTLPLMIGAIFGPILIFLVIAIGGKSLLQIEWFQISLRVACFIYLIYLAYKIASAKSPQLNHGINKPVSMAKAFALQWLNPKIWSQYIIIIGVYITPKVNYELQIGMIILIFMMTSIPTASLWVLCGKLIARYLTQAHHYRIFNITMAILLLLAVVPSLLAHPFH